MFENQLQGSSFDYLQIQIEEQICTVTLNRPPVNALSRDLVQELNKCCHMISDADHLRVILLTNAGDVFCAGADLKERRDMNDSEVRQFLVNIRDCFFQWYSLKIPTICAMQGGAFGGGLELALMADFRLLSRDAEIGFPETRLAIIPGAGGTQRLSRLVGETRALKWILTGKKFTAEEALEDGVVMEIGSSDDILCRSRALAREIQQAAPIAVKQAKQAIKDGLKLDYSSALRFETECYNITIPTEDRKEALEAFAEKRKPHWQGS